MLTIDMEIATENYFINGILQAPASNTTAARGVDGCTSTTVIIAHDCGHQDNHPPGVKCRDGIIYSYYEIKITVFCPGDDPLAEVPEVFVDIAGPSGGATPANPVDPNIALAAVRFKLYIELSHSQRTWWDNTNNSALKNDLITYLNENSFVLVNGLLDGEALAFTLQLIEQARLNPTLNFDVNASANSPANIDRSAIDNSTPEGQKFNEIYNELANVPEFKALFIDIFGGLERPNVKFILGNNVLSESTGAPINAKTTRNSAGNYTITINKQILKGQNGLLPSTKLEVAKSIIHECIHAYIFTNSEDEASTLSQLLNLIYPNDHDQHDFMFDIMSPVLETILHQLVNHLTTVEKRIFVENLPLYQNIGQTTSVDWNWNTYSRFLGLLGLQESLGFTTEFPAGSDNLFLFTQYTNTGHINLDY